MGGISLKTCIPEELYGNFGSGKELVGSVGITPDIDRVAKGIVVKEPDQVDKPAIRVGLFNSKLP